jgi:hypothetical protein
MGKADSVIELYEDDEGDTPIRVENAKRGPQRIERLPGDNPPAKRSGDLLRQYGLPQRRSYRLVQAHVEYGSQKEDIEPVGQEGQPVTWECGQQRGGERHQGDREEKSDVNPRKPAIGAR